jgi:hypothetical protein
MASDRENFPHINFIYIGYQISAFEAAMHYNIQI